MNILVLHYYKSTIDGVMTSMIDTYFNLKKICNPQFKIICPELYLMGINGIEDYYDKSLDETQWHEYVNDIGIKTIPYNGEYKSMEYHFKCFHNKLTTSIPFLRFNRNFGDFNLFFSIDQKNNKFESDVIICSGRLIYEILNGANIELKCNRLIVLDSMDTWKSKVGIFQDFDDFFDVMKNTYITQLSNPATMKESKYEQIEYYHKFSHKRLFSLRQCGFIKNDYIFKRSVKKKTEIGEGLYYENMGKGIFENLWFGKEVIYDVDGMFMEDGLYYYMNLFGLDAFKNQKIKLSKKEIKNNLFFNENDYLYKEFV